MKWSLFRGHLLVSGDVNQLQLLQTHNSKCIPQNSKLSAVCLGHMKQNCLLYRLGTLFSSRTNVSNGKLPGGTLPETNIAPENRPSQKETIVFQPSIFRGYVSFRECNKQQISSLSFGLTTTNLKSPPLLKGCSPRNPQKISNVSTWLVLNPQPIAHLLVI